MNRHLATAALALLYVLPVWGLIRFAPDATAWLLLHAAAPQGALALAQDAGLRGEAYYAQQRWPEAAQAFALAGKTASYNQANALAQAGALEAAIVAYDVALAQEPGEEDAGFNRALAVEALYRQRLAAAGQGAGVANAAASVRAKGRLDRMAINDTPTGTGDGMAAGRESSSRDGAPGSGNAAGQGAGRESQDSGDGKAHGAASDAGGAGRKGSGADAINEAFRQNQRKSTRSLEAQLIQPSLSWLTSVPDNPRKYLKTRLIAEKKQRLRASVDSKGLAQ